MKNKKLIKYHQKQTKNFYKYFERVLHKERKPDIHQLRLSIKRIRSLLTLIEFSTKNSTIKNELNIVLKDLFKKAGAVRENQLNLQMVSQKKLLYIIPYKVFLAKTNKKTLSELIVAMNAFDHERFHNLNTELLHEIESLPGEQVDNHEDQARIYLKSKLDKIIEIHSKTPDDEELHKMRRQVKRAGEALAIIGRKKNTGRGDRLLQRIQKLDKTIGKWHDYKVLILSMQSFLGNNSNKDSRSYMNWLIGQYEQKAEQRRTRINQLLDSRLMIADV